MTKDGFPVENYLHLTPWHQPGSQYINHIPSSDILDNKATFAFNVTKYAAQYPEYYRAGFPHTYCLPAHRERLLEVLGAGGDGDAEPDPGSRYVRGCRVCVCVCVCV